MFEKEEVVKFDKEDDTTIKVAGKADLKKLTAAIVYKLQEKGLITVRCIGEKSIVNAVKALSKVCDIFKEKEQDLYFDLYKEDMSNEMGKFVVQIFEVELTK